MVRTRLIWATCVILAAPSLSLLTCKAQNLTWRERTELKVARAGYMAGVIDGKYVIAGGSHWVNGKKIWTDEVDIYDPSKEAWTTGAPLPEGPRSDSANVVVNNSLYIFGGGANGQIRQDSFVYREGKWHPLPGARLPVPLLYSVAATNRGLIYVLGGLSHYEDYSHLSNRMWVWDPAHPKTGWKELTSFPGPGLITAATATLNHKIYVLGGAKTGGKDVVNVNTAYEYDPSSKKWTVLPPLPIERRCWWGLAVDQEILLFGGHNSKNESDVFAYSPARKTLTNISQMPHGLCDAKFFRIGNSIYGVGGESAPGIRGRWTLEADMGAKQNNHKRK